MLESLIIGIISGLVSSFIIYILVFRVKPNIKISNEIARIEDENGNYYEIKIVNKSKIAIYNVKYILQYCYVEQDGNISVDSVVPRKEPLIYIPANKKNDKNDKHAVRISYCIDENKFSDESYLLFTFIATHGLTNTTEYVEKIYKKDDIVDGAFESGNSLKFISTKRKRIKQ